MKKALSIFIFWLVITSACDPCRDCGKPLAFEPTVEMIFINQDSAARLAILRDSISDSLEISDSLVAYFSDSILILEDSVEALDLLIADGATDLVSIQTGFNSTINDFGIQVDLLNADIEIIDSIDNEYESTISLIENGNVQLQKVSLVENGSEAVFEDSASFFNLPLLIENGQTQTTFNIIIDEKAYEIGFDYQILESVSESRIVKVSAGNIDTIFHTFDSLFIECISSDCISNETTVTAYF